MRVVLVHNPVSGRGRALVHARMLQQALERAGHGVVSVASAATDAHDWLAPRMDQAQALLVVGGDGTVRSVAQVGAESGVPLVHVPMGTENLVARCMQMRKAVPDVLNTLEHGRAVQVDLAMVNGEPMLLMVSAGIDAQVVAWVADRRGSAITRWIYVRGLLSQLPRHAPGTVHARVDGEVVVDGAQGWLIIANSPDYGARFDPVPHARMDDGRLDLLFLPGTRPRHMVQWALRSRLRRHLSHGEAVVASGRTMDVRFEGATPIQIDGDQPWGACRVDTLTVSLAPDKLTVLLPPWARQVRALSQSLHPDSTSAALG
jgi:diacylglycerol kinase family enzyme